MSNDETWGLAIRNSFQIKTECTYVAHSLQSQSFSYIDFFKALSDAVRNILCSAIENELSLNYSLLADILMHSWKVHLY